MKLIELIYENNNDKFYVEFGAENGMQCNTRILRQNYNWNGLQMDGDYENESINLKILEILKKYIGHLNMDQIQMEDIHKIHIIDCIYHLKKQLNYKMVII
jgi:hypothetical protein